MLGYKDKTWCDGGEDTCVERHNCHRYFSDEEKENAIVWWGNEVAPVSFFLKVRELDCYREEE